MVDLEFVGDYRHPQHLTARQRELGFDGTSQGTFTFADFLDVINPLQHIPIISTLYRQITGDEISPAARIFGDTLFGGPTGFVASVVNTLYEQVAGEDIGDTVVAMLTGEDAGSAPQFAQADGAAAPSGTETAAASPTDAAGALQTAERQAPAVADPTPAPTGDSGSVMLTGQDAMKALFHDLGGGRSQAKAIPLAGADQAPMALPGRGQAGPMKSFPLPSRHTRIATKMPTRHLAPATAVAAQAGTASLPETRQAAETQSDKRAGSSSADQKADGQKTDGQPAVFAQEVPQGAIAKRMMEALDKYEAMTRQREARQSDESPHWSSDPAVTAASGS